MMFCAKPHHDAHVGEFEPVASSEEEGSNGNVSRPSIVGAQADIKAYNELLNQEDEGKGGHDVANVNEAFIH